MPIVPPPAVCAAAGPADFGGWYLRGDIGFSNQRVKSSEQRARCQQHRAPVQHLGFDTARHLRPRRRLSVQQLVPRRRHRRVSRQVAASSAPTRSRYPGRRRHRQLSRAASPNGSFWPTPMSISAPGGASRRSSAPVSAARGCRSRTSPIRASANNGGGARPTASHSATTCRNGISPGRCMPVSPTRSRRTSRSNSPTLPRPGRRPDRRSSHLRRHQQRRQPDDVQGHHLARPQARRALESRQRRRSTCRRWSARADRSSRSLNDWLTARDLPAPFSFARARKRFRAFRTRKCGRCGARQRLVKVNER